MSTVNMLQEGEGRPQKNGSDPTRVRRDAVLKNVQTCSVARPTSYSNLDIWLAVHHSVTSLAVGRAS